METTLLEAVLLASPRTAPLRAEPGGLYVKLFGPLNFHDQHGALDLRIPALPRAVLAYLLLMRRGVHQRKLAELFWSHGGESALNSLYQTVHRLRRYPNGNSATKNLLVHNNQLYSIDWKRSIRVDWHEFKEQVALAQRSLSPGQALPEWLKAYDFCHEPLLEDFSQNAEWALGFRLQGEGLQRLVAHRLADFAREHRLPEVRHLLVQKFSPLSAAS